MLARDRVVAPALSRVGTLGEVRHETQEHPSPATFVIATTVAAALAALVGTMAHTTPLALAPSALLAVIGAAVVPRRSWVAETELARHSTPARCLAALAVLGYATLVANAASSGNPASYLSIALAMLVVAVCLPVLGLMRRSVLGTIVVCAPVVLIPTALVASRQAGALRPLPRLNFVADTPALIHISGPVLLALGAVMILASLRDVLASASRLRDASTLAGLAALFAGVCALLVEGAGLAAAGGLTAGLDQLGGTAIGVAVLGLLGVYSGTRRALRTGQVRLMGPVVFLGALAVVLFGAVQVHGAAGLGVLFLPPTLAMLGVSIGAVAGLCLAGSVVAKDRRSRRDPRWERGAGIRETWSSAPVVAYQKARSQHLSPLPWARGLATLRRSSVRPRRRDHPDSGGAHAGVGRHVQRLPH